MGAGQSALKDEIIQLHDADAKKLQSIQDQLGQIQGKQLDEKMLALEKEKNENKETKNLLVRQKTEMDVKNERLKEVIDMQQ